jgi:hypothetical protein
MPRTQQLYWKGRVLSKAGNALPAFCIKVAQKDEMELSTFYFLFSNPPGSSVYH